MMETFLQERTGQSMLKARYPVPALQPVQSIMPANFKDRVEQYWAWRAARERRKAASNKDAARKTPSFDRRGNQLP